MALRQRHFMELKRPIRQNGIACRTKPEMKCHVVFQYEKPQWYCAHNLSFLLEWALAGQCRTLQYLY